MYDSEKIRAAAEAVIKERGSDGSYTEYFAACDSYDAEATPETVLALLDEIERLRKDAGRYRWLRDETIQDSLERPFGIAISILAPQRNEAGNYDIDGWAVTYQEDADSAIDAAKTQGGDA